MDAREVAHRRFRTQRIVGEPWPDPGSVVAFFGAVQAQEYPQALWSLSQRTEGLDEASLRRLVDEGAVLRTHALRPTWHFVAPADLGWIQALTGPRVLAQCAYIQRQVGLDEALLTAADKVIVEALRGGNHLTRNELARVLEDARRPVPAAALAHVVMHTELLGLIASGPMRGKQHTYALVEERVDAPLELSGDAALAELTRRFFVSHGPATVKDFAWWSSLTLGQIKRGLDLAGSALESAEFDGQTVWFDPAAPVDAAVVPTARLLGTYDELLVPYATTRWVNNLAGLKPESGPYPPSLTPTPLLVDTQLAGRWRRRGKAVELDIFTELTARQRAAVTAELARYAAFAGAPR